MSDYQETLYDGYGQRFRMDRLLHEVRTEHQHLVIFENARMGRVMALDGVIQTTEADEFVYHEMLAHVPILAHGAVRRVLVIGVGDGGILREIVRHAGIEEIVAVEIDPRDMSPASLAALAEMGVTRASIGVQDFDPEIQKTIGRLQSYELTRQVAEMIRERGVRSLNADILYGLPHQTQARISDSVQKLLTLSPDRVALYGYAHVPWMKKHMRLIPEEALPDTDTRWAQYEQGTAKLESLGIDSQLIAPRSGKR